MFYCSVAIVSYNYYGIRCSLDLIIILALSVPECTEMYGGSSVTFVDQIATTTEPLN